MTSSDLVTLERPGLTVRALVHGPRPLKGGSVSADDVGEAACQRRSAVEGSEVRDAIHRRRWRGEEGMSLVEVMVAVFVLSVGLLALASTALTSIVNLRVSRGRQEAVDAASALIEDLRRTDYSLVALDANDPAVTALGDCEVEYQEPIVTTSQAGAIPHVQTFGPSGRVTLTTYVSWYDEGDDNGCTDTTHDKRVRRVQVFAKWTDRDRTFTLEESTLVAPVDRGLPAPDFRVGTPTVSTTFTQADVTASRERCVGHVLRNLGADDSYEWTAVRTDSGSVEKNNAARMWTADGKFYLRTFLEHPAQDPPLDPSGYAVPKEQVDRTANLPPNLELMSDGTDSDTRPEAEADVQTGEQARLWVCMWPGSNASVGDTAEFDITFSSEFDPNRVETVHHSIEVVDTFHDLYLYDDDESDEGQSGPRAIQRNNGTWYLPVLPMGPTTSLQPERLGTATTLPNYDDDIDPIDPGTRLWSTSTYPDANRIVFHEQVNPTTTFKPTVNFDLWLASEDALEDLADGDSTTTPQRVQLKLTLQVLDKNENQVQSTIFSGYSHGYDHTDVGWMRQQFSVPASSDFTVQEGQYLHLTIECDEAVTTDECHLAYDHTSLPSRMSLAVRS